MGKHSIIKNFSNVRNKGICLCSLLVTFLFIFMNVMGVSVAKMPSGLPGDMIRSGDLDGIHIRYNEVFVGVISMDYDNRPMYAVESSKDDYDYKNGYWKALDSGYPYINTVAARLIQMNRKNKSNEIQLAVAYAIHDHLDSDKELWSKYKRHGFMKFESSHIETLAAKLWHDAQRSVIKDLYAGNDYLDGGKKGKISVSPKVPYDYTKLYIDDVKIKIVANNKLIHFDETGKNEYIGNISEGGKAVNWTADGDGEVKVDVFYEVPRIEQFYSPKLDVIRNCESDWKKYDTYTLKVQKHFQPMVSSEALTKELSQDSPVIANVSSFVGEIDSWPKDMSVRARGYYFVGKSKDVLNSNKPNANETTESYLNRLRNKSNIRQVAAAYVNFTSNKQKLSVEAKKETGDFNPEELEKAERYKVTDEDAGMFGGWVWVISKSDQDDPGKSSEENKAKKDLITGDYIDGLGGIASTYSHRTKAKLFHDSSVKEKSVGLGKEIVNTITIGGLPDDYGEFNGDDKYKFSGDAKAHIKVWWAGDGTDNATKEANDKYRPGAAGEAKKKEPTEDSHHRLIGDWEVPAKNGVYTIGNGKIMFKSAKDADSNGLGSEIKSIKSIRADKTKDSGWYVFVYSLPGSSRTEEFTSEYDDVWSRTLVEPSETNDATNISLTTSVSSNVVSSGESFHDIAHIVGKVPKGSYVVFNAYSHENVNKMPTSINGDDSSDAHATNAVSNDMNASVSGLENKPESAEKFDLNKGEHILTNSRVNITDQQASDSSKNQIDINSMNIKVSRGATVYWKAELYGPNGKPLASHTLGDANETVHVVSNTATIKPDNKVHGVGEPIRSTIYLSQVLDEGSYVEFTAWDAVEGEHKDSDKLLLNHHKINIPNAAIEHMRKGGSISVVSPEIQATREGIVYWKAELFDSAGKLIVRNSNSRSTNSKPGNGNQPGKVEVLNPSGGAGSGGSAGSGAGSGAGGNAGSAGSGAGSGSGGSSSTAGGSSGATGSSTVGSGNGGSGTAAGGTGGSAGSSNGSNPSGAQASGGQTSGTQTPGGKSSGGKTPGTQTPGTQTPGGKSSGGQTSGTQTSGNGNSGPNASAGVGGSGTAGSGNGSGTGSGSGTNTGNYSGTGKPGNQNNHGNNGDASNPGNSGKPGDKTNPGNSSKPGNQANPGESSKQGGNSNSGGKTGGQSSGGQTSGGQSSGSQNHAGNTSAGNTSAGNTSGTQTSGTQSSGGQSSKGQSSGENVTTGESIENNSGSITSTNVISDKDKRNSVSLGDILSLLYSNKNKSNNKNLVTRKSDKNTSLNDYLSDYSNGLKELFEKYGENNANASSIFNLNSKMNLNNTNLANLIKNRMKGNASGLVDSGFNSNLNSSEFEENGVAGNSADSNSVGSSNVDSSSNNPGGNNSNGSDPNSGNRSNESASNNRRSSSNKEISTRGKSSNEANGNVNSSETGYVNNDTEEEKQNYQLAQTGSSIINIAIIIATAFMVIGVMALGKLNSDEMNVSRRRILRSRHCKIC